MYRILTLDGGGMKGLYSAAVLDELVARYPRLLETTDLIAGTSTGGLIALALADGRAPGELVRLFRRDGRHIFDDSFWDDLRDLGNAAGADYGSEDLGRILEREFGDRTLADLEKRVLVPAFDLDAPPLEGGDEGAAAGRPRTWKPKFFHNFPGSDGDGAWRVTDVALATTAAPTFFPSHRGFIDGGVFANNPSIAALAQALSERGGSTRLEDVRLLSIGNGAEPKYIEGESIDWGWGQWARPLIALMIAGTMGVADFQCRQLLGEERYRRVDSWLRHPVNMDDTRDKTLDFLELSARSVDLGETLAWLERTDW